MIIFLDSYKRQIVNIFNLKNDDWYHVAPDKRGFYAFPLKYIEPYLIGSTELTQGSPVEKLKYHKFKLSDDKSIWSHFTTEIPRNEIESTRGSWALSTIKSWKKGLSVAITQMANTCNDFFDFNGERVPKGRPSTKFGRGKSSFDYFEVFIPAGTLK